MGQAQGTENTWVRYSKMTEGNNDNDGGHSGDYPLYLLLTNQFYYSSYYIVEETEAHLGFK